MTLVLRPKIISDLVCEVSHYCENIIIDQKKTNNEMVYYVYQVQHLNLTKFP